MKYDPRDFRHDRSAYERPDTGYVCGRARIWGRPCWQGPGVDGSCGGTSQCAPVRDGGRWECRRPKRAGGPCRQGPLPDGRCAHTQPPCKPAPSLRRWRRRLSWLAVVVVLASIAAYANFSSDHPGSVAALDPGDLSSAHQGFTAGKGCAACHRPHEAGASGFMAALVTSEDQSEACLDCHAFGGPDRAPHNMVEAGQDDGQGPACRVCHSEHKGTDFEVARVEDVLCSNCHEESFSEFGDQHPSFPVDFPYQEPNSIYFDHVRHLREYFVDERFLTADRDVEFAELARTDCRACHQVASATREVRPRPFEQSCAGCHGDETRERELVLYSPEEVNLVTAMLLGLDEADIWSAEGEDAARELLADMAEEGLDAFADRTPDPLSEGSTPPDALYAGLSSALLREAAAVWLDDPFMDPPPPANVEYEMPGWRAGMDARGFQSVHYRPRGHADPVIRSWIEALAGASGSDEGGLPDTAQFAMEQVLDPDLGAGACGKCHAAGVLGGMREAGTPVWEPSGAMDRPHFRYTHAPHLRLLTPDAGCLQCHRLDPSADYAGYYQDAVLSLDPTTFQSNFKDIDKETCMACHRPGAIRRDCQTCHTYHKDPYFREDFQTRGRVQDEQDTD